MLPVLAVQALPAFAPLGVCPFGQKKIFKKLTVAVPLPSKMPLIGLARQDPAAITKATTKKRNGSTLKVLTGISSEYYLLLTK